MIDSLKNSNEGRLADLVVLCFDGFLPLALESVERGGTVLLFSGAAEEATLPGRVNDVFWRTEITLTSTYAGSPADCRTALDLIRSGSIPLKRIISHRLPLKEGAEGFKAVSNPLENECVKVIIKPHK
jgi:L-iditol 2-dehydrogenase